MSATLHDDVIDNGPAYLVAFAEKLYLCDSKPTTFTEASSTFKLGTQSGLTWTGPQDGTPDADGREVILDTITSGSVDSTGEAKWFAITDDSLSKLLLAGSLANPKVITAGNDFSLTGVKLRIPDPA